MRKGTKERKKHREGSLGCFINNWPLCFWKRRGYGYLDKPTGLSRRISLAGGGGCLTLCGICVLRPHPLLSSLPRPGRGTVRVFRYGAVPSLHICCSPCHLMLPLLVSLGPNEVLGESCQRNAGWSQRQGSILQQLPALALVRLRELPQVGALWLRGALFCWVPMNPPGTCPILSTQGLSLRPCSNVHSPHSHPGTPP